MKETRVELFKKYRDEIAHMEDESSFTNKEKASRKVDSLLIDKKKDLKNTSSIQLSYDDLLETSEFYKQDVKTRPNPLTPKDRKDKIFHVVLITITILTIIALIVVGILYFGGK